MWTQTPSIRSMCRRKSESLDPRERHRHTKTWLVRSDMAQDDGMAKGKCSRQKLKEVGNNNNNNNTITSLNPILFSPDAKFSVPNTRIVRHIWFYCAQQSMQRVAESMFSKSSGKIWPWRLSNGKIDFVFWLGCRKLQEIVTLILPMSVSPISYNIMEI